MQLIKSNNRPLAIHIHNTTKEEAEICVCCDKVIDKRLGMYFKNEQTWCVACYENSHPWRPAA